MHPYLRNSLLALLSGKRVIAFPNFYGTQKSNLAKITPRLIPGHYKSQYNLDETVILVINITNKLLRHSTSGVYPKLKELYNKINNKDENNEHYSDREGIRSHLLMATAFLLANKGKYSESLNMIDRANKVIQLRTCSFDFTNEKGILLMYQKDHKMATKHLWDAWEKYNRLNFTRNTDRIICGINLACVLALTNQTEGAREMLQTCFKDYDERDTFIGNIILHNQALINRVRVDKPLIATLDPLPSFFRSPS
jgi:tetratricopeptide (TPR) repeat protein